MKFAPVTRSPGARVALAATSGSGSRPGAPSLLIEIRSGENDDALIASLCGACGVELRAEQTDVPRASVLADEREGDGRLRDRLSGWAVIRLGVKRRPGCGAPLPGPITRTRIEIPEE